MGPSSARPCLPLAACPCGAEADTRLPSFSRGLATRLSFIANWGKPSFWSAETPRTAELSLSWLGGEIKASGSLSPLNINTVRRC